MVNEAVSFADVKDLLEFIIKLSDMKDVRNSFMVHDYFCIHPSFLLLDSNGRFFDPASSDGGLDAKYVSEWRSMWLRYLNTCDRIVLFSECSKRLLESVYGTGLNTVLEPHKVSGIRTVNGHAPDGTMRIAVIGDMMPQKGSEIVRSMCASETIRTAHAELFHYGTTYVPPIRGLTERGKYERMSNAVYSYGTGRRGRRRWGRGEDDEVANWVSNRGVVYNQTPNAPMTYQSSAAEEAYAVKQAQQALVDAMYSIKGQINYTLTGPQDPDTGYASCASTVAWAYRKVLGYTPGGSGFASSAAQSKDENFVDIVRLGQPGHKPNQTFDLTQAAPQFPK